MFVVIIMAVTGWVRAPNQSVESQKKRVPNPSPFPMLGGGMVPDVKEGDG